MNELYRQAYLDRMRSFAEIMYWGVPITYIGLFVTLDIHLIWSGILLAVGALILSIGIPMSFAPRKEE
jgi:hypothetical protein